MKRYLVSADHVVPRHGCKNVEAIVSQSAGTQSWYAVMPGYGCSKDYASPEMAIRAMLTDHACTNICITAVGE
jgi:hypothetical protein